MFFKTMLSLTLHRLATWIPKWRAVAFSNGSIYHRLHPCIWLHKARKEKPAYCVNYNRSTVCLGFPSSSHCYQNAIEEIRIYWQLLWLFIFCQALQGKYLLFCQHLFDAVPRCTCWHSLAKAANAGRDFSRGEEAVSLPCLLAHLVLPVNERN